MSEEKKRALDGYYQTKRAQAVYLGRVLTSVSGKAEWERRVAMHRAECARVGALIKGE